MMTFIVAIVAIIGSLFVYLGAKHFHHRFQYPFTLPLLTGTIVIVCFLLLFRIPYEIYYTGGKWLEMLLGPAVVALAYPLYQQLHLLKKYFFVIIIPVIIGAIVGMASGLLLARLFQIDEAIVSSIVPKSVTTPVAMDVAATLGGISSLAAILVMIAGIGGVVLGPYIFKWLNITTELGKGLATGCASHAIGTAKALENSEQEGAISSVAMILSAIVVSIIAPILVLLFN